MAAEKEVEITLKTIGPIRPSRLLVPSSIKVHDLRKLIAKDGHQPMEQLKLVLRGKILLDQESGDEVCLRLKQGDSLIVAVTPKPPVKHIRDGDDDDDDDDDDLKFQIPQSANRWKKKLFTLLHDKFRLPDILLMAIFSISLKAWIAIVLWFILSPVAYKMDVGPLYILATGFSIILLNLGKRPHGDLSAYSIFNEGFRELPGTLNAERLDRDIRAGQF
ncbi:ubiquitin family protein [Tasmannia lanceolata]|uniref:ubiquitin family protein n=1 Tax=Tasmannia lanceolata TaxID=3420 RepID=UPI004062C043